MTTAPVPANAAGLSKTTRRTMLAAIGAMPIAASSAAAVCRPEQDDAELLTAIVVWRAAYERKAKAWNRFSDLQEQYLAARPARPDTLRLQPDDLVLLETLFRKGDPMMFGMDIPGEWIRRMAAKPMHTLVREACPPDWGVPEHHVRVRQVPDPIAQARADEIVQAHTAWEADCKTLDDFLGLERAELVVDRACKVFDDAIGRLTGLSARTWSGAAAKAQVFLDYLKNSDGEAIVQGGEMTDAELALLLSILRDVAALGKPGQGGSAT